MTDPTAGNTPEQVAWSQSLPAAIAAQRTFFADVLGAAPLPPGVALEPFGPVRLGVWRLSGLGDGDAPTLLWVHGGGFVAGTVRQTTAPMIAVARATGMRFLAPDYPLAPEHPFPAAPNHLAEVYAWVVNQVNPRELVVVGESAGGALALAMLLLARDAGLAMPAGAVLLSPAVDLTGSGPSFRALSDVDPVLDPDALLESYAAYLGRARATEPTASPLFADLAGLPPLLIQVGTDELLLDDSIRLVRRAADAHVATHLDVLPHGVHGSQAHPETLAGRAGIAGIETFLRGLLSV